MGQAFRLPLSDGGCRLGWSVPWPPRPERRTPPRIRPAAGGFDVGGSMSASIRGGSAWTAGRTSQQPTIEGAIGRRSSARRDEDRRPKDSTAAAS